jgi:Spy/CpxP family protein refolding chaperone
VKTRLSVIGVAVFLAVLWSPGPRAAGSQSTGGAAKAQPQTQGNKSDSGRAQSPNQRRGPWLWWKDAAVMKEIGMSESLSKKIDALFHKRIPQANAQWTEFKKHEDELNRLIAERKVGADVISVQLDRVEAQRTTLNKSRTMMMYEMYQLLSADQYAKLVAFNERRRNGRGNSFR